MTMNVFDEILRDFARSQVRAAKQVQLLDLHNDDSDALEAIELSEALQRDDAAHTISDAR